jgi:hypothetical protein
MTKVTNDHIREDLKALRTIRKEVIYLIDEQSNLIASGREHFDYASTAKLIGNIAQAILRLAGPRVAVNNPNRTLRHFTVADEQRKRGH